ncbi:hypothetical protein RFI_33303, partial [Reticulomyxa filosa]
MKHDIQSLWTIKYVDAQRNCWHYRCDILEDFMNKFRDIQDYVSWTKIVNEITCDFAKEFKEYMMCHHIPSRQACEQFIWKCYGTLCNKRAQFLMPLLQFSRHCYAPMATEPKAVARVLQSALSKHKWMDFYQLLQIMQRSCKKDICQHILSEHMLIADRTLHIQFPLIHFLSAFLDRKELSFLIIQ